MGIVGVYTVPVDHHGVIPQVEWSDSGSLLATGSLDRMAQVWRVADGPCESPSGRVGSEADHLPKEASGDSKSRHLKPVSMWRLRGHDGRITSVRFIPGEKHLLTGQLQPVLLKYECALNLASCDRCIRDS